MNISKFTVSAQEVINNSIKIAQERGNPNLVPLHVLAAALENDFCKSFFGVLNINILSLQDLVTIEIDKLPSTRGGQLTSNYTFESFLDNIIKQAEKLGDAYASLEHFMLVFSETNDLPLDIRKFFKDHNFNYNLVMQNINSKRKGKVIKDKDPEGQYDILDRYCQNLTNAAKQGRLDPVIGRHEEIRRVIQILSRRTKNNPVLIGEPGVGKTAIVEGIAQRIINNDVPESLKNNLIYS